MSVKVFGVPGSPYVRAVMMGLEEKRVGYDFVAIAPGDSKSPEHLARHPFGRVPAFAHDGFSLYETQAILRYVDAAFDGPALRPSDIKALARMDQLVGICDWYLFPQVGVTIGFQRIVKALIGMGAPDEEITRRRSSTPSALCGDRGLLQAPFLTGAQPTIADIMIAAHMSCWMARWSATTPTFAARRLARAHGSAAGMQKTDLLKRNAA